MIKIYDDYELFLEINKIEQCLTGYSLDFIKSIAKNYKYYELIENIIVRIWYESYSEFSNNLNSLISYIDNKSKESANTIEQEFKWNEIDCLEKDFGIDLSMFVDNKSIYFYAFNYKEEDKKKYILNIPLSILIHMLDYRSNIKNKDFNQFLDFVESIPIIKEFKNAINNLYKDNTNAAIKEIER